MYTNAGAGYNLTSEYQSSGLPFCSNGTANITTPVKIEFPFVTKGITVFNHDVINSIKVGFTLDGINGSFYTQIDSRDKYHFDARVVCVYILSNVADVNYSIYAPLTSIARKHVPNFDLENYGGI
jgi:hypothetical protein